LIFFKFFREKNDLREIKGETREEERRGKGARDGDCRCAANKATAKLGYTGGWEILTMVLPNRATPQ
jgi:hypothetical protein